jgi:hypothetical protein
MPHPLAEYGKTIDRFSLDEYASMTSSLCHDSSILRLVF